MLKSNLIEKQETPKIYDWSDPELDYNSKLRKRLEVARDERDTTHDEFDGMTYLEYCETNRKGMNTYIAPRENKTDTNFVTGTTRDKALAYLATINNLDLSPDIQAYNEDNVEEIQLGEAMEDVIERMAELTGDAEKKLLRQYVLLEQGTVFVEELWESKYHKKKKLLKDFTGKKKIEWTEKLEKVYEGCGRNVLLNENVYLGDITKFDIKEQPFIYTVEKKTRGETRSIYGEWEMWDYVPIAKSETVLNSSTTYNRNWQLLEWSKDYCEIIKYQDATNCEYQIMINGMPMLPIGFPLPWGEGYNITKQILEIINPYFAYGKSLPTRLKTTQAIIDEMMRLAILKTQKSFSPPYVNNTGRVLSSKIFYPGKITMGIDPNALTPLEQQNQGVNNSEVMMLEMLKKNLDEHSVNPQTQGQSQPTTGTATEMMILQQQAQTMMGLTEFSAATLEKKLAELRLDRIIKNWFNENEKGEFNSIEITKLIAEEGIGKHIVQGIKETYPSLGAEVANEEAMMTEQQGMPIQKTYIDAEKIKDNKYKWFISVVPKQKKTSALSKVMFDAFVQKVMMFPNVNLPYIQERLAVLYEENPAKVFMQQQPPMPQEQQDMGMANNAGAQLMSPINKQTQMPSVNTMAQGGGM